MPREVTDADGTTWSCAPAYAGLATAGEMPDAARVAGEADRYHVVCTPSGGAKSVRVQVPEDWETAVSDDELARLIREQADADG